VLALVNTGRRMARYPLLAVEVWPRYWLSPHGLDGNGRFGLPPIEFGGQRGSGLERLHAWYKFGSQGGTVIHSGVMHPITRIVAEILSSHEPGTRDLRIKFGLAAEGVPFHDEERIFIESQLVAISRSNDFELL
jgi:hypothetical protein